MGSINVGLLTCFYDYFHGIIDIFLLNQARVRALEDLEMILNDKNALQAQINILEIRLAETDARIKVAAQEKIHVELLGRGVAKAAKRISY